MNKQIEEIKAVLVRTCKRVRTMQEDHMQDRYAEALYTAGYRKQSGWISVDERFPERNGGYLTHCKIEGQSLVCILYYCKVGGFNEGTVTHWMPLPEAPKGGAE